MTTREYLVQLSTTIDELLRRHYILAALLLITQPAVILFFLLVGELVDVTEERLNKKP